MGEKDYVKMKEMRIFLLLRRASMKEVEDLRDKMDRSDKMPKINNTVGINTVCI